MHGRDICSSEHLADKLGWARLPNDCRGVRRSKLLNNCTTLLGRNARRAGACASDFNALTDLGPNHTKTTSDGLGTLLGLVSRAIPQRTALRLSLKSLGSLAPPNGGPPINGSNPARYRVSI